MIITAQGALDVDDDRSFALRSFNVSRTVNPDLPPYFPYPLKKPSAYKIENVPLLRPPPHIKGGWVPGKVGEDFAKPQEAVGTEVLAVNEFMSRAVNSSSASDGTSLLSPM
jgi:hypothetical protein